jgi:hypothetical protein
LSGLSREIVWDFEQNCKVATVVTPSSIGDTLQGACYREIYPIRILRSLSFQTPYASFTRKCHLQMGLWYVPVVLATWETERDNCLSRSSRPAWATWQNPISKKKKKSNDWIE